jgi:DNA-directed RNA polymerase subunit L
MVSIKTIEKESNRSILPRNVLRVNLSGEDINSSVINTLRRLSIALVPSYAFHPQDITIEKNTSVFNNDQMKLRLSNMPLVKPVHDIDKEVKDILDIELAALMANSESKKEFIEIELERETRKTELMKNLHMFVEAKNTTSDIMSVTTEDAYTKFYIDDKKIANIYKNPVLIIQLKPGEEFKCVCVASRDIHMRHNIYSPCANVRYEEMKETEFELRMESYGQIPEKDILVMACNIFLIKLANVKQRIDGMLKKDVMDVELTIENENYTMGNILVRTIQDHPNVSFCGLKIDNPFENNIVIRCVSQKQPVIQVIGECTDKLNKLFTTFISAFEKI